MIFSEEKNFNFDGSNFDGQSYWCDLKKDEHFSFQKTLRKRVGYDLVGETFSSNGKGELIEMKCKQNAKKYTEVLQ